MRIPRTMISAGAAIASLALVLAGCSGGNGNDSDSSGDTGTGTLKLWHYESANGAMGRAWDKAIEVFKTEHPGVTVEFERKAFEQIQQNASMILASDQAPDLMEYNKGNATAGLLSSRVCSPTSATRSPAGAGTRRSARACRPPPSTTRRA